MMLHEIVSGIERPVPERVYATDVAVDILTFAVTSFKGKGTAAIATLVEIRGGAAKALGSHMAIASDGRYCGYVSGGCVEASVAAEALIAMKERHDRQISFGEGSPYFDIVLPCGGGITVAIHVLNDVETLRRVLLELENRRPAGLAYNPATQSLSATQPPTRSAWDARGFVSVYRPPTRLIISGHTIEAQTTARHGEVSGCEVIAVGHSDKPGDIAKMLDVHTAVVFLHHDLDVEAPLLRAVLPAAVFYIGALGSTQTHRERIIRLKSLGFEDADLCRIKAPIGMFGPARDAQSLALSVLADVAASRLAAFG